MEGEEKKIQGFRGVADLLRPMSLMGIYNPHRTDRHGATSYEGMENLRRYCRPCDIYWIGPEGDRCFNCGRSPSRTDAIVAIILGWCPSLDDLWTGD
jgi:hypothetical protein